MVRPGEDPAPPPPWPPPGPDGLVFRAGRSIEGRRGSALLVAVPLFMVIVGLLLYGFFAVLPMDPPDPFGGLLDQLPDAIRNRIDPLQAFFALFFTFAAYRLCKAVRYRRCMSASEVVVHADGTLAEREGLQTRVSLHRLHSVDAEPNPSFVRTWRQMPFQARVEEVRPVGSAVLLLLTDASGTTVRVNPGAWEDGQRLAEIIRAAVWHGDARVTPAAARASGLPEAPSAPDPVCEP